MAKIDLELEKRQKKKALSVSLILIAAASVIMGLTNWIYFAEFWSISIMLFSTAGVCLIALWLNLQGKFLAASIIAVTIGFAAVYLNIYLAGGLRDPGIVSIPVAIVFAGLLFGRRVIPFITVFSVIVIGVAAWLEISGIKIVTLDVINFNTFIVISVFTICAGMTIDVIMKNNSSMLERIRDDSGKLLESELK
ncbi:MAG: hypothetical protein EHM28_01590 [Spirochaetaceae bacterium]|nr:MAG: hypothetical protein EHM28_01590 [Spirochaetaceae bacterium]